MISLSRSEFRDQSGFGFFGLVFVICFLAMGTAALITMVQPFSSTSEVDVTYQKMVKIQSAIALYRSHHYGQPPANLSHLVDPVPPICAVNTTVGYYPYYRNKYGWCGPYIDRTFQQDSTSFQMDSWGNLFRYDTINLISCGPNRSCGDGDDLGLAI